MKGTVVRVYGVPRVVVWILVLFACAAPLTQLAQAQTFTVIRNFTGGADGAAPTAGLTIDRAGNLYGTASVSPNGDGVVFRLSRRNSGWILTPLYSFQGGHDGSVPYGGVSIAADGNLYGTTYAGGLGYGTVFKLQPSPVVCVTALCPWTETVLYRFAGGDDGANPLYGNLVFDQTGSVYGTTSNGGSSRGGTVYKVTHSGGGWTESVLYSFAGLTDGLDPVSGVIFDQSGNLYGATVQGGAYFLYGTIYELTSSGTGWMENILYSFSGGTDGGNPYGSPIFGMSGNLYGTAWFGGSNDGGTVYQLTPANGTWDFGLVFSLQGEGNGGPTGSLTMDALGNLYGTTFSDGVYGSGSVFKLTPTDGGWTYTSLHDFTAGDDGAGPWGGVAFDASGNMYGTTSSGGGAGCGGIGCGVVWEITP
jgi:uncharacterized repeat protein (TIGR03803 family)